MQPVNVFDYEAMAQLHVEKSAWQYYQSGADDEITLRANRAAYERMYLRPRVLVDVSACDLSTTVLGMPVSMPIMVAPMAFHSLAHPEGECATARGAAGAGALMVVSISATCSLESIAEAACGTLWFQLYIHDRARSEALLRRVEDAGYHALVVTLDASIWGHKERSIRSGFRLPPHLHKANFPGEYPDAVDTTLTWDCLGWLRSATTLPLVLKGILTAEDAALACEYGVDGIIVSNHGGRQLDGAIPSILALPEVVSAVKGRCEVYLDSGIRRGTDVLKALALGARAVLVGRPVLWGLAANGAEGVSQVLEILRAELHQAMMLSGRPTIASIDRSLIHACMASRAETYHTAST